MFLQNKLYSMWMRAQYEAFRMDQVLALMMTIPCKTCILDDWIYLTVSKCASKAGLGRGRQGRATQGIGGQGRAGQGREGQVRARHWRAKQGGAKQGKEKEGRAGQCKVGQDKAR